MNCSLAACQGEYEERRVVHTVKRNGQVIVIANVPALVCPVCGDVLLTEPTVLAIEAMLEAPENPIGEALIYEYRQIA